MNLKQLSMSFSFKALTVSDITLLHTWFQDPIVKKWYAQNKTYTLDDIKQKYLPRINGLDKTPSFIIEANNNPIGFIQYYALCDHFPSGVTSLNNDLFKIVKPEKVAGIDVFIADQEFRYKGFGKQIIDLFINKFLKNIFEIIIVDPRNINKPAIRCYEKCGFQLTMLSEDKDFNLVMKIN